MTNNAINTVQNSPPPSEASAKVWTTRQQRLRSDIISTAGDLFRKQGFESTSINDIGDIVGISHRTFFRYFQSKEDLAFSWLERQTEFIRALINEQPPTQSAFLLMNTVYSQYAKDRAKKGDLDRFLFQMIFDNPSLHGRFLLESWKFSSEFMLIVEAKMKKERIKTCVCFSQFTATNSALAVGLWEWAHDATHQNINYWVQKSLRGLAC